MSKKRVFLDTNVFVELLSGRGELLKLFSDDVLNKVAYVTSPVVFQELFFAAGRTGKEVSLEGIERHIEIIPVDITKLSSAFKQEVRKFRNLAVHSNDVLIISTADEAKCDYLLTYDKAIIQASEKRTYKAITPEDLLRILG